VAFPGAVGVRRCRIRFRICFRICAQPDGAYIFRQLRKGLVKLAAFFLQRGGNPA